MLNLQQLSSLLQDLESDHVERTQATDKTDKFAQAICAFANDLPGYRQPGYLIVGVDGSGKSTGLNVTVNSFKTLLRYAPMAIFSLCRRWPSPSLRCPVAMLPLSRCSLRTCRRFATKA